MSFVTAALIGGGVALGTGLLSANAAGNAASLQSNAANNATQTQLGMFNTINQQQAPYRQTGYNALSALSSGLGLPGSGFNANGTAPTAPTRQQFTTTAAGSPGGFTLGYGGVPQYTAGTPGATTFDQTGYNNALSAFNAQPAGASTGTTGVAPGYFTHQFNAADLNSNLAPNYQFMLDQGLGAVKNAGNLQTGLLSGNTLKGINDYAQNYAGNAYQNAFQNYTTNQTNIYNRLANIAGLGQTANQSTGNIGAQLAGNAGQSIMAGGAAQAAGQVGQANAIAGAGNNALGWYTLSQIMNKGNSGGNIVGI